MLVYIDGTWMVKSWEVGRVGCEDKNIKPQGGSDPWGHFLVIMATRATVTELLPHKQGARKQALGQQSFQSPIVGT